MTETLGFYEKPAVIDEHEHSGNVKLEHLTTDLRLLLPTWH